MKKILIIKLDEMGDVLRTTPILRVLEGEVTWVTKKASIPLFENNQYINEVIDFDEAERIKNKRFDLILNLNDKEEACELASKVKTKELIGAYLKDGKITYTENSAEWFDMGLLSRFGKEKADELKRKNKKSHQEILFNMFGKKFNGEEYILNFPIKKIDEKIIGMEERVGKRWPLKKWNKYRELAKRLEEKGFTVKFFEQRDNIRDYIEEINNCNIIVTGDTLAMHIALALKKRVITIFGPTSDPEIYDYGRLKKIVTLADCKCCYKQDCDKEPSCMDVISVVEVLDAVENLIS